MQPKKKKKKGGKLFNLLQCGFFKFGLSKRKINK